jgi:hypothetical protein
MILQLFQMYVNDCLCWHSLHMKYASLRTFFNLIILNNGMKSSDKTAIKELAVGENDNFVIEKPQNLFLH